MLHVYLEKEYYNEFPVFQFLLGCFNRLNNKTLVPFPVFQFLLGCFLVTPHLVGHQVAIPFNSF